MSSYIGYIIVAGFLGFLVIRQIHFRNVRKNLSQFIIDGALVIDVRSPEEFSSGHFDNSINIPLPQLKAKASTLDQTKPILLCCASGNRSGMGTALLKGIGFKNVMNAGPWSSLKK